MSSEEKTEQPTLRKLRQARKRGEVVFSKDLTGAVTFAAVVAMLWFCSDFAEAQLRQVLGATLGQIAHPGPPESFAAAVEQVVVAGLWLALPPLLLAAVTGLLIGLLQTRGNFSAEPLQIKFDKLDIGATLKQLFSTRQLGVLVQLVVKLGLLLALLVAIIRAFLGPMVEGVYAEAAQSGVVGAAGLRLLFAAAAGVLIALGVIDFLQQHFEYIKRNRMSKSERKRENKDQNGDPQLKQQLKTLRRELVEAPVKLGASSASVIVTNPTHYAVGLYYAPGVVALPIVVAKGHDASARAIRADAAKHRIPVLENPPLARALHAGVELGGMIGDEHLEAVAEVFRWLARRQSSSPPN